MTSSLRPIGGAGCSVGLEFLARIGTRGRIVAPQQLPVNSFHDSPTGQKVADNAARIECHTQQASRTQPGNFATCLLDQPENLILAHCLIQLGMASGRLIDPSKKCIALASILLELAVFIQIDKRSLWPIERLDDKDSPLFTDCDKNLVQPLAQIGGANRLLHNTRHGKYRSFANIIMPWRNVVYTNAGCPQWPREPCESAHERGSSHSAEECAISPQQPPAGAADEYQQPTDQE